ncbi:hypothetical protein EVAR_36650_1 [Eumeta japonica]|uniref:Uncharacterized protein n=1 Tax=Eumeta variegata TaxID=151549 RepID=A0A4C1XXX7_EUMVA|nr:hypothetical protein EVAR_36650_1 [Eumeta japonica]
MIGSKSVRGSAFNSMGFGLIEGQTNRRTIREEMVTAVHRYSPPRGSHQEHVQAFVQEGVPSSTATAVDLEKVCFWATCFRYPKPTLY